MHKWIAVCALVAAARLSAAVPSTEREALVALYQSTNGAGWKDKTNWLQDVPLGSGLRYLFKSVNH